MSEPTKIDWKAVRERLRLNEQRLAEVLSPNPEQIQHIQAERAARVAVRRHAIQREATVPMLIVRLGEERFAIDATTTSEVVRISSLATVAGAPRGVAGVTNVRGELYSVLNLPAFLRSGQSVSNLLWGITLRHATLRVLIGVEEVLRLENVPESAIAAVEENVLRIQDGIAILLDTQVILDRLNAEHESLAHSQEQ